MNKKKIFAMALASLVAISSLAGCASKKADETSADTSKDGAAITSSEAEKITLPISKDKITLSYFAMPESYVVSKMKGYADMAVMQQAEKLTNVAIKWREESYTDPKPKMNLMFSTGEPEDIIWDAFLANGGAKKLLDDGLILPLNSYIDKYAPNLKKLMKDNPRIQREISTDDGRIYMFPEIRLDPTTRANSGFAIRKDWLDKLNLKVPTTVDEWYTVLKAFKEKDPNGNGQADEIPFVSLARTKSSQSFANFALGFGFIDGFYVDNGKIKFAPSEANYKNYITTMRKWYSEGLLDPEYTTQESKNFDAKMTGDKGGAYYGSLSGNFGKYINAKVGTSYDLVGTPMPKAPDGKVYVGVSAFAKMVPHGASIGKNNKHVIETVKWLDWHYSEQGHNLFNWGVEGQSYQVKDGKKTISQDLIFKNPDKLTTEEAWAKYAGGNLVQMPTIDDPEVYKQLKGLPQQVDANKIWASADISKILPDLFFSEEVTQENANIMSEINTYIDEMINKFIMGLEPMENYDKFAQKLKDMKIDKVLQNYQASYDKQTKK